MSRLVELQEIAKTAYQGLQKRHPDIIQSGGCLLLGKQYAHPASKVLVLGINPGGGPTTHFDVGPQSYNYLLDGPDKPRSPYWTNARKFFNASPRLQASVRLATFSFCSPFRTPAWSSLPAVVKSSVANASQAILLKIVRDCRPRLIIITGVDGFRLFTEIMGATLGVNRVISKGGEAGAHQWAAYDATVGDDRIVIAQVPHFSRAGVTAKLHECAEWLEGLEEARGSAPN